MRKGFQKYSYSRSYFGQWLARRRQSLGWSYRRLAQVVYEQCGERLYAATILHVERGDRSLPESQRVALVEALAAAENSRLLVGADVSAPPVAPTLPDDPDELARLEYWAAARDIWIGRSQEAEAREMWPDWARDQIQAGLMELSMGRLQRAKAMFERTIAKDPHLIGLPLLSNAFLVRGWLALELRDFAAATYYLRKSGFVGKKNGQPRERIYHFLGKTYCAWGVAEDNENYRKFGIELLSRSSSFNKHAGVQSATGYDILQQIPSLIYDNETALARRYLRQSQEMLGARGSPLGHYSLCLGQLALTSNSQQAREHFMQAYQDHSGDVFYPKGLASALRFLSHCAAEEKATLPRAAEYALVAAILHPYRQSRDLLEEVALRVFVVHCDSIASRFVSFWRKQEENTRSMNAEPFTLLRRFGALYGSARIEAELRFTRHTIQAALPESVASPVGERLLL